MDEMFYSAFSQCCEALQQFHPPAKLSADGYQLYDFFSGCGGLSLGFAAYASAFGVIGRFVGVDINQRSAATYRRNLGESFVADVREIADASNIRDVLSSSVGFDPGRPTILVGCPPCQGFSAHTKTRGIPDDERNSLILDFAKIALAIEPEAIVIENVPQILSGKYRIYWERFSSELRCRGYHFTADIHNLATFGVPQQRNRAICMAVHTSSPMRSIPDLLLPAEYVNVRQAIGDLPVIEPGAKDSPDLLHRTVKHRPATIEVIEQVASNGGSRPRGVGPACLDRIRGFYDVYGRLAWDKPSITMTRYSRSPASGRFTHPEQHRSLSAREVARLQSFPDGFALEGSLDDIYRQIGEAVPPRAAAAVACWLMQHVASSAEIQGARQAPVGV